MGPSGTPIGTTQSVSPALLRLNSTILGSQGDPRPPQAQYNINLYGNATNISSLLNQTFGNGTTNTGPSGLTGSQQGNADAMASSDPLANNLSTDVGFTASSSSLRASSMPNSGSSGQVQNKQMLVASQNAMVLDQQSFQHAQKSMQQHPASHGEQQQQKLRFQSIQGGLSGMHHVKLEPQMTNNHIGETCQIATTGNG